jgi:hypothetical protein
LLREVSPVPLGRYHRANGAVILQTRMLPPMRPAATLLSLICLSAPLPGVAQSALPQGWRVTPLDSTRYGVRRIEATGLPAAESMTIREGPLRPLSGATIDSWLASTVADEPAPDGRWVAPARVSNVRDGMIATVAREYLSTSGVRGGRIHIGVAAGEQQARLLTLTVSSVAMLQLARGAAARAFMTELATATMTPRRMGAGVAAGQTTPTSTSSESLAAMPPSRQEIRPGGALTPGRYTGVMVNNDGKIIVRYDVTLFPNGEYAAASGDNLLDSAGTYRYSAATGRLDIDGKLYNNSYRPDEDFCFFGRDSRGDPVIYAEDFYGVGTFRALLRRVSDVDREPPSVLLATRNAARAEADRYKHVTAPGAGLRSGDIEAVYYEWKQVYEIDGLKFREEIFLLLTDGTVRRGLPVAPQDLDVTSSKRSEPESWGRWRKVGASYEFAFPSAGGFARKQGYVVTPARPGINLQGTYDGSSSSQIPGGAGAWSKFGVAFMPGARFEKFRSGGMGMTSGSGDTRTTSAVVYDDKGSAGSVTSPVFGGGSSRTTPDTGNRRGTYHVEGYAIILTYDNGRIERLPFVVQQEPGGRVKGVWMLGSLLSPAKE